MQKHIDLSKSRIRFWEFTHLNSACFDIFWELFSEAHPNELHIIQLDNGGLHRALSINIPENVILVLEVDRIVTIWSAFSVAPIAPNASAAPF